MKRTVLTFGLISGAISALMTAVTMPFIDKIGFGKAEILGYTAIVVSFLMVYVGIRAYRDNVADGTISFGRAFSVGILITLISCLCYVAMWEFLYFNFSSVRHFMDKSAAYMVEQANASGASQEVIQTQLREIERYKKLYANPVFNAAVTFAEPFPVGLIITLLSAAILRKEVRDRPT